MEEKPGKEETGARDAGIRKPAQKNDRKRMADGPDAISSHSTRKRDIRFRSLFVRGQGTDAWIQTSAFQNPCRLQYS
ncbi:MAG TPA: hypothetical protein DCF42_05705 [Lachnospiraceae bacterium]|nr:hypothetical protein [Lachnospiraceae bacterium]